MIYLNKKWYFGGIGILVAQCVVLILTQLNPYTCGLISALTILYGAFMAFSRVEFKKK